MSASGVEYFHMFASVQGVALEEFAKGMQRIWGLPENPDNFSPEMIAEYIATFSDPKTLRAALNWYNGVMDAGIVACPPVLSWSTFEGNADFAAMIECVLSPCAPFQESKEHLVPDADLAFGP